MRKYRACGCEWNWLIRCLHIPTTPPEWWYRYSRRQRRFLLGLIASALALTITLVVLIAVVATHGGLSHFAIGGSADNEATPVDEDAMCNWSQWRLPGAVRPLQYRLRLSPQLQEPFRVDGTVEIDFHIANAQRCIVLSAAGLNISSVYVSNQAVSGSVTYDEDLGQATLRFDREVDPSFEPHTLKMSFNYTLSDGLSGFYRSSYKGPDDQQHTLATTQFEANAARKAFPCFDEPAFKAEFGVTLVVPEELTAISNMPQESTSTEGVGEGMIARTFMHTPPMSSYLLAFIVGNITRVSGEVPAYAPPGAAGSPQGPARLVSIWGTPGKEDSLREALDIAKRVLPAYEALLKVPFALPKLDLEASITDKRYVASVVAHEMAHQWFGNLVTMEYWGELWLNEGFATYFEDLGATAARPAYLYKDYFFDEKETAALEADALTTSNHPLATLGLDSDDGIEAMFDGISYDKGGSVLRMLHAYLNATITPGDTFLAGLSQYLQDNKFGSVTSERLWQALQVSTSLNIPEMMHTWTYQQGAPLLNVTLQGSDVHVTQAPLTLNGTLECGSSNMTSPWTIHVAVASANLSSVAWKRVDSCSPSAPIYTLRSPGDWVKLNAGALGYYRVMYDEGMWDKLARAVDVNDSSTDGLQEADYAQLLDDSSALSEAGLTPVSTFLNLTRALPTRPDTELMPWRVASGYLAKMQRLLPLDTSHSGCDGRLNSYVRDQLIDPFLAQGSSGGGNGLQLNTSRAVVEQEPVSVQLLRPLLFAFAGTFGDATVNGDALALLNAQGVAGNEAVDPSVRSVVYNQAVLVGGGAAWNIMRDMYRQATAASERERTLGALCWAQEEALRGMTLDLTLSSDVRSQDINTVILGVARHSREGLQAAWDFYRRRWNDLAARLGGPDEAARKMGRLLESLGSGFASQSAMDEVDAVYAAHKSALDEQRYADGAKEAIESNMRWLQQNAGPACAWLSASSGR
ncbi:hypothetical protein WJX84_010042, partial [Apatococcus fuscideae]